MLKLDCKETLSKNKNVLLQKATLLLEQERIKWKSSENELMQQLKKEITEREKAEE